MKTITKVWTTETSIWIEDADGNQGFERFSDYPRLKGASAEERNNFSITPFGIRWENLDEDLSFEGFFSEKKRSSLYQIFIEHPELNAAAIARRLGFSQSLFAQYISGHKQPSKEREEEIIRELHSLGKELLAISV